MIGALVATALAVALDNARVAAMVGLVERSARRRRRMAVSFAAAEALALVLGMAIGELSGGVIGELAWIPGAALLAGLGAVMLIDAVGGRSGEDVMSTRLLAWLPFALSFDNAAAGVGLGLAGVPILPAAATVGAVSGLLSFAALEISAALRARIPAPKALSALGMLCAASLVALAQ